MCDFSYLTLMWFKYQTLSIFIFIHIKRTTEDIWVGILRIEYSQILHCDIVLVIPQWLTNVRFEDKNGYKKDRWMALKN